MAEKVYDTVIVGSGVAGYAAALQASRAGLSTLLFQGFESGGRLMLSPMVEDYLGFEEGIPGEELMDRFEEHAARSGADMRPDNVGRVDLSEYPFELWAEGEEEAVAGRTVIVATGVRGRELGVGGENRLMGRGVSGCALCDAFMFKHKKVAVVGGGDRAMEEALFLRRFASEVSVIHRRQGFRASWIMLDRVRKEPRIYFVTGTVVEEILGESSVEGVRIRDVVTGRERELDLDGVFVAIGQEPKSALFEGMLDTDEEGYVVRHEHTMTSISGIFAAGGVSERRYRQAVTAAGEGFMAAIDAERWLRG